MTDRFVVPEPSRKAVLECYTAWRTCPEGGDAFDLATRAAYAVDVPALVQAELVRHREWQEREFLAYQQRLRDYGPSSKEVGAHPNSPGAFKTYLAERFGPEPRCLVAGTWTGFPPGGEQRPLCNLPTGHAGPHSWEAEERCGSISLVDGPCTHPKGHLSYHSWQKVEGLRARSATEDLSLAEPGLRLSDAGYRLMTPEERAFLRALAEERAALHRAMGSERGISFPSGAYPLSVEVQRAVNDHWKASRVTDNAAKALASVAGETSRRE